jgi:rubredoxin
MASQIGNTRTYTSVFDETNTTAVAQQKSCPLCKVTAVPRGINTTRKRRGGKQSCPNCGHVYGGKTTIS